MGTFFENSLALTLWLFVIIGIIFHYRHSDNYENDKTRQTEVNEIAILSSNVNCDLYSTSCVRYMLGGQDWRLENCDYHTCTYQIAFTVAITDTWPVFLSSKDADYVGVGMTTDKDNWTNTEVIGCKKTPDKTIAKFYQRVSNPRQNFVSQDISNSELLELQEGGENGTEIWCSFIRHDSDIPDQQNTTGPLYFIYFWGKLGENGEVGEWPKQTVQISEESINLSQPGSVKEYHQNPNSDTPVSYTILFYVTVIFIVTVISCIIFIATVVNSHCLVTK